MFDLLARTTQCEGYFKMQNMQCYRGSQLQEHIEDLGKLRIAIFREYPYLYEGNLSYEYAYLSRYTHHPDSLLLRIDDEAGIVGACTGLPLIAENESFQSAFPESERAQIFYIGELLLRPDARGNKIGTTLFAAALERIDPARYPKISLCMVEREHNHPLRPANYISPAALASRFGFVKTEGLMATLTWKDVGDSQETAKPMQIWMKG